MVRKLSVSLQVSATVHALVVTFLVSRLPAEKPPVPPAPTIELIEAAPVEVTVLDVPATAAIPEAAPEPIAIAPEPRPELPRDDRPTETAAITTGAATTTTGAATSGTTDTGTSAGDPLATPGKKNPLMDMRKGAPVRLTVGVPTGRWDGREHAPDTYGADIDSGRLDPSGGGTYRSDEGVFTARVDRDGSVSLKDSKNFNIRLALPRPKQVGRHIASWYEDKNKPVGQLPPGTTTRDPVLNSGEASGHIDRKPDHGDVATVPIVSGGFDVTDALMRQKGIDPYAARKLAYLDATRDQRVQIGQRHRAKQLEQAAVIMKGNLDRVWSLSTPAARREALFELWDECAETGSDDLVAAGRAARTLVIGVIRSRLPVGTAEAFTAEDLASFNRKKQSKARFAPYN